MGSPEAESLIGREQDALIGRTIDGRYRILSLIATGGMGRVYKAEQSSLGRLVALKVLALPESARVHDPHFKERFALEAATASRLSHPNTVTIFDYGRTDDDIYYIVMEYVEGVTLSRVLKRERRLAPARALSIASQVCQSLWEAHASSVIHRDIKPSNILLRHQGQEWVKVLDFGIARFMAEDRLDRDLTRIGAYVGTPEYMAPECFHGKVDIRSDVYSVGVVMYVMLTGQLPFQGETGLATVLMSINEPVPGMDPRLGVPRAVETLVRTCLEKDPDLRYQTVGELFHNISSCLHQLEALRTGALAGGLGDGELDPRLLLEGDDDALPPSHATHGTVAGPRGRWRPRKLEAASVALVAVLLAGGVWWAGGRSERGRATLSSQPSEGVLRALEPAGAGPSGSAPPVMTAPDAGAARAWSPQPEGAASSSGAAPATIGSPAEVSTGMAEVRQPLEPALRAGDNAVAVEEARSSVRGGASGARPPVEAKAQASVPRPDAAQRHDNADVGDRRGVSGASPKSSITASGAEQAPLEVDVPEGYKPSPY